MRAAAYFSPRSWRPRWRRGRVGSVPCASLRTWLEGRIIGESHPPPLHWPKRVTRMVSIEGRAERARSAERRGHAEQLLRVSKPGWGAAEGSRARHRCQGSGWHQGHRRLLRGGARRRAGGPTSCSSPSEMGGLWLSSGLRFKTILLVRLSEGDWGAQVDARGQVGGTFNGPGTSQRWCPRWGCGLGRSGQTPDGSRGGAVGRAGQPGVGCGEREAGVLPGAMEPSG